MRSSFYCAKGALLSAVPVRHSSTTGPAPEAVAAWIKELTSRPPTESVDRLDWTRSGHLSRALPTRQEVAPLRANDVLPLGHHLAYFQPETYLKDLGEDGSSREYNAPAPYLRRMWAGGSMIFRDPSALRIDSPIHQNVSVPSVDFKKGMIFVNQQRDLHAKGTSHHTDGWAIREIRTHVFRQDQDVRAAQSRAPTNSKQADQRPADVAFAYTPTSPLLFLFSALTHNAHKIHYDKDWTKKVEGHPDLLVHAPLTALLLLEVAAREGKVERFDYRATSPTYVDLFTSLEGRWAESEDRRKNQLELMSVQEGRVGMKATAVMSQH